MRHAALLVIALVLGGCFSGAVLATVRTWLAAEDGPCADWCALDIDCGGDAREQSACVTTCRASEDGLCADESSRLHACEAKLTCAEYRDRLAAVAPPCAAERAASTTCEAQR